jgi:hypothetical protein
MAAATYDITLSSDALELAARGIRERLDQLDMDEDAGDEDQEAQLQFRPPDVQVPARAGPPLGPVGRLLQVMQGTQGRPPLLNTPIALFRGGKPEDQGRARPLALPRTSPPPKRRLIIESSDSDSDEDDNRTSTGAAEVGGRRPNRGGGSDGEEGGSRSWWGSED